MKKLIFILLVFILTMTACSDLFDEKIITTKTKEYPTWLSGTWIVNYASDTMTKIYKFNSNGSYTKYTNISMTGNTISSEWFVNTNYLVMNNDTYQYTKSDENNFYMNKWTASGYYSEYIDLSRYIPEVTILPDEYESNNDFSSASSILVGIGNEQTHSIYPQNDTDYLVFSANLGRQYRIQFSAVNPSNSIDYLDMTLYNSSQNSLAWTSGSGSSLYYDFNCSTSGNYYIRLNSYNTGGYKVAIIDQGSIPTDTAEPDNSQAEAKPISFGIANKQFHSINPASDQDWISFVGTAGNNYTIETSTAGNDFDSYLYLYAADGSFIISNDDGGVNTFSKITTWSCPSNAAYFIKVTSFGSSSSGDYYISVIEN
ncbi:MAG: hypothetical protein KAS64_00325 [Spirochaetes bacterium]|nr:hypothetical protein [Spirochaetota bacterium]